MHLYLIRHGQSFVNLEDWDQGYQDAGLTELGERQAAALAEWFPKIVPSPDILYCSTLARTRETVAPLAAVYGQEVIYDDRIREIGNNSHDHVPYPSEGLPHRFADFWSSERPFAPVTDVVENAEAMIHFRARIGIFIEEVAHYHADKTVVVVCHGGVIDVIFDHVFDTGMWRRCEVWTKNTGVTHIEYVNHPNREAWRLHFHNNITHLSELLGEM